MSEKDKIVHQFRLCKQLEAGINLISVSIEHLKKDLAKHEASLEMFQSDLEKAREGCKALAGRDFHNYCLTKADE